ncbi:MAG: M14 family metallopeptidase [Reyranellaceae bacterium]
MSAAGQSFSQSFAEAREKFLAAADRAGGHPESFVNPNKGPAGETLATDVAWFGDPAAGKALVCVSGTHGVEGFCGSGWQIDWLRGEGRHRLPPGVGMLLVHAINPYGFCWIRRVTEENVDLNRNFVDHARPHPDNPGYRELADYLIPRSLDQEAIRAAEARLEAYRRQHGDIAYYRAISAGQYSHADGLFYGGNGPTWSNRTTHAVIDRFLKHRQAVAVVDFHTGLGPYGYGELIGHYDPGTPGSERQRRWYGPSLMETKRGMSASQARDGLTHYGYNRALAGSDTTVVTLEFGTYPREPGHSALRADHWLHKYGDPLSAEGKRIKAMLRDHFYPDRDDWKEMILFRGYQVTRQALAGLASS